MLHRVEHLGEGGAGVGEDLGGPDDLAVVEAFHEQVFEGIGGRAVALALLHDVGIEDVEGGLPREPARRLEGGQFVRVLHDAPDENAGLADHLHALPVGGERMEEVADREQQPARLLSPTRPGSRTIRCPAPSHPSSPVCSPRGGMRFRASSVEHGHTISQAAPITGKMPRMAIRKAADQELRPLSERGRPARFSFLFQPAGRTIFLETTWTTRDNFRKGIGRTTPPDSRFRETTGKQKGQRGKPQTNPSDHSGNSRQKRARP
ncbi:MAG: hypothetical protein IKQ55_10725 [Kiritimatiellae bacterium]|nr:hypothetical protein [Kiritimatiellia bacterium]